MECLRYFKYMVWQNKEDSWAKAMSSMHFVLGLWVYLFINFKWQESRMSFAERLSRLINLLSLFLHPPFSFVQMLLSVHFCMWFYSLTETAFFPFFQLVGYKEEELTGLK